MRKCVIKNSVAALTIDMKHLSIGVSVFIICDKNTCYGYSIY